MSNLVVNSTVTFSYVFSMLILKLSTDIAFMFLVCFSSSATRHVMSYHIHHHFSVADTVGDNATTVGPSV